MFKVVFALWAVKLISKLIEMNEIHVMLKENSEILKGNQIRFELG